MIINHKGLRAGILSAPRIDYCKVRRSSVNDRLEYGYYRCSKARRTSWVKCTAALYSLQSFVEVNISKFCLYFIIYHRGSPRVHVGGDIPFVRQVNEGPSGCAEQVVYTRLSWTILELS